MEKETLEEAAERLFPAEWDWKEKESFIEGAQWQAERMYSEEDVFNLCRVFATFVMRTRPSYKKQQEWFEQFKKK